MPQDQEGNKVREGNLCFCRLVAKSGSTPFVTPWTATHQILLSIAFSRQEYWSGSPFPSPGDLPNPGTEPEYPALAGGYFTTERKGKPNLCLQKA